ncbi:MAG: helix-turn-helix transcriptional regulator [Thermoplasmata archaeon]
MIGFTRLKNLINMLGYDRSCSRILISLLDEDYFDVSYIARKTGYSRSMVSLILKRLSENGIIIKRREGHKYVYNLNERFLLNIYDTFLKKLEYELKYISNERKRFSGNINDQINFIKNNIKNIKGEAKWQK